MRKYWAFFKVSVQNTLTYRGPILVWMIANIVSLIVFTLVWFTAESNGLMGGFSRNQLITYGLFGLFLQWIVNWYPFYWLKDDIASGEIVGSTLLKPLSLYSKAFAQEIGWHVVTIFVGLAATLIVGIFIKDYLVFPVGFSSLFLICVSIALTIMINFTLALCMGMVAFWTPRVGQLDGLLWMGKTLLGGQGIPVAFFPQFWQPLVYALPFRYMFSFPIEIYLGNLSSTQIVTGMIIGTGWLIVFVLIYKYMWAKGRAIYTSYGS